MKSERTLIFVVLFALLTFLSIGCASATTHYVSPGESIQAAVDNATTGDTIIIRDGTYTENVDVNKSLTIRSENGSANCIVQAENPSDHIFEVTADYVNISGFTVKGVKFYDRAGIYLSYADHCIISNNTASNNRNGIYLWYSSNNMLKNNNANSNSEYGIYLYYYSSNNTLTNNSMTGNKYNFGVYIRYIQNIDTSNRVDGKPVYYCVNQQNKQIPSDAGFVGIVNSVNITVRDLTLTNNGEGVLLAYSKNSRIENVSASNNSDGIFLESSNNNTLINNNANSNNVHGIRLGGSNNMLTNNTASNNVRGIFLYDGSNNVLTNNTASNNGHGIYLYYSSSNNLMNNTASNNYYGVYLWSSSNNKLTSNIANDNNRYGIRLSNSSNSNLIYNNYFNNTNTAWDDGNNIWSITKQAGTNIIGGTYLGGNYWTDYEGEDLDGDGLGDTLIPYNSSGNIQNGGDYLPLVPSPLVVQVNITIKPETLNLKSKGLFTAFIALPGPYNITDINISTVVCEGAPAVKGMIADDKYIAKFNRQDLVGVPTGNAVTLTVTGELTNGTPFEGGDTFRVIDKS